MKLFYIGLMALALIGMIRIFKDFKSDTLAVFFRMYVQDCTGAITIGQVRSITHDLVLKSLADGVYNSAAGFRNFYKNREKKDGGNNIGGPVIIGGSDDISTGNWYAGAANLPDSEVDDITRAFVDWKQIYETVLISKLDIMKNNGTSQILDLAAEKVKIAEKKMKARLARGVFQNTGNALAFDGLFGIVAATGDYAGLSIDDIKDEFGANAWLAFILALNGPLTQPSMQLTLGKATEDEDRPQWAFMKQNVYNELWNILSQEQRIIADDSSFSGGGHDQKKVLVYNGLPHYVDSHAIDQTLTYINNDYTKLYVHTMEDMEAQKFDKLEDVNAVKSRMLLTGNLFCNRRKSNSQISGITVVA